MVIDAAGLRRWAERLCELARGGRAEAARALELTARLDAHRDYALVEPPPAGATRLRIFDDLATHTTVDYIDVELAAPGPTLAQLQQALGDGQPAVRVSVTSPHKQWFRIELDGAPCTCDVFAVFDHKPGPTSTATAVTLRRNPSPSPAR